MTAGELAVSSSVRSMFSRAAECLLSLGAPIGKTFFLQAAQYCDVDMLTILVLHGAVLDCVDESGKTAVELAIRGRKPKNVEYLLRVG